MCVCESCKQRAISPTSRRPNFTKFAHKTWIGEEVNPSVQNFEYLPVKGRFLQKTKILAKISNDLRLQAAITP